MATSRFELHLPNPYRPDASIAADVRGIAWTRIASPHREGDRVVVPAWMLDAEHRVDDETAWTIKPDHELAPASGAEIVPGGVAVVMESPHKSEFDGCGGVALGPLRHPTNRQQFSDHAPALLRQASEVGGIDVTGRSLVLANGVQYQTSLQALREGYGSKIETGIRDVVWTELFNAGGGDDLVRRLATYRPALVLLASTRFSMPMLVERLSQAEREWPVLLVDEHPSRWWLRAPTVTGVI